VSHQGSALAKVVKLLKNCGPEIRAVPKNKAGFREGFTFSQGKAVDELLLPGNQFDEVRQYLRHVPKPNHEY
jgi:hypothetical protein